MVQRERVLGDVLKKSQWMTKQRRLRRRVEDTLYGDRLLSLRRIYTLSLLPSFKCRCPLSNWSIQQHLSNSSSICEAPAIWRSLQRQEKESPHWDRVETESSTRKGVAPSLRRPFRFDDVVGFKETGSLHVIERAAAAPEGLTFRKRKPHQAWTP